MIVVNGWSKIYKTMEEIFAKLDEAISIALEEQKKALTSNNTPLEIATIINKLEYIVIQIKGMTFDMREEKNIKLNRNYKNF